MRLWFGKFRNCELETVPEDYLCWMVDNMDRESLRELARGELERRAAVRQQTTIVGSFDAITLEMIEAGYRVLAKRFHPDVGGDSRKMQQLNEAMERFRR